MVTGLQSTERLISVSPVARIAQPLIQTILSKNGRFPFQLGRCKPGQRLLRVGSVTAHQQKYNTTLIDNHVCFGKVEKNETKWTSSVADKTGVELTGISVDSRVNVAKNAPVKISTPNLLCFFFPAAFVVSSVLVMRSGSNEKKELDFRAS